MDRINGPGHVNNRFVEEDPATLRPPTEITALWMNGIQEEQVGVIEGVGMVPNAADNTQLRVAINKMIEARVGDYSLDTGAANAYVVAMNPPINAYTGVIEGVFHAANANTAASTLNAGGGALPLRRNDGTGLQPGDIPANAIVAWTYDPATNIFLVRSMVPSQAFTQAQADLRYAPLSESSKVPVRQTILNGAANIVRIAYPAGMGALGAIDYVGSFTADQVAFWSGLTANATNYLFIDRNPATGVQTGIASALPYIAQLSDVAISTAAGQHTYLIDTGVMYVGTGAAANVVQRTAVGECITMGRCVSAEVAFPTTATPVNLSHNLGVVPKLERTVMICKVAELGFSPGDEMDISAVISAVSPYNTIMGHSVSRNGLNLILNTGNAGTFHKTTSTVTAINIANWRLQSTLQRGF
jgi:hypothetical protein